MMILDNTIGVIVLAILEKEGLADLHSLRPVLLVAARGKTVKRL
jgi:hypothetical protein